MMNHNFVVLEKSIICKFWSLNVWPIFGEFIVSFAAVEKKYSTKPISSPKKKTPQSDKNQRGRRSALINNFHLKTHSIRTQLHRI